MSGKSSSKNTKSSSSKNNRLFWYVVGGILLLVLIFVFVSSSGSVDTGIDYSLYNYSDSDVQKPDAAHTITVFEDFQCPACGAFAPILKSIKSNYDVNVDYKHFPLKSIHPYAQLAAEASECARDQGRFWAFHDVLYDHQDQLSPPYLKAHAQGLGLDMELFNTCFDGREKQVLVAEDVREGTLKRVSGTPTVFVDGELVKPHSSENIISALNR